MTTYVYLGTRSVADDAECGGHHFAEKEAKEAILSLHYKDRVGHEYHGKARWTIEQLEELTSSFAYPIGTTIWDKYVAYNVFYSDLCKVLDDSAIIKAGHAFFFADDDAPSDKIYRYVRAMESPS